MTSQDINWDEVEGAAEAILSFRRKIPYQPPEAHSRFKVLVHQEIERIAKALSLETAADLLTRERERCAAVIDERARAHKSTAANSTMCDPVQVDCFEREAIKCARALRSLT